MAYDFRCSQRCATRCLACGRCPSDAVQGPVFAIDIFKIIANSDVLVDAHIKNKIANTGPWQQSSHSISTYAVQ